MLYVQNSPYIKSFHYNDVDDFLKAISYNGELYNLFEDHYIFRGHSTDIYELVPSALRGYLAFDNLRINISASKDEQKQYVFLATTELIQIQEEYRLLQDFFRICDDNGLYLPHIESLRNSFYPGVDGEMLLQENKWIPKEYWELSAFAQHHGVKTRLLDWTHNIFVALYFASMGVYYDPKKKFDIQEAYYAKRKGEEYPPKYNIEIWALDIDVVMAKPTKMPLHIIQPRYHNNDNLRAQKGMFTFWETTYPGLVDKNGKPNIGPKTDRRSLDVLLDLYLRKIKSPAKHYLYRITMPQDAAYSIYSFVERMGYNASTLFPGYDGVARFLRENREIHHKK